MVSLYQTTLLGGLLRTVQISTAVSPGPACVQVVSTVTKGGSEQSVRLHCVSFQIRAIVGIARQLLPKFVETTTTYDEIAEKSSETIAESC